jgi:hypothetical protein
MLDKQRRQYKYVILGKTGENMTSPDKSKSNLLGKLADLAKTVDAPCPIGKIHKQLDPEVGQALLNALQSPASNSAIHRALIDEGFSISRMTINQKRHCFREGGDGGCACFPNNLGGSK